MSTPDKRWPAAQAMAVAYELIEALKAHCERIQVAGSLRREKPDVGDVELLYIPKHEKRALDMFTEVDMNITDEEIGRMLGRGDLSKRPSKTGIFTWGEKNKLALHRGGIPVDLFATTTDNWWTSLVVRTGGLETNLRLTKAANERGRTLLAYGCGVKDLRTGEVTQANSEREVFELCGVPFLEPTERP